MSHEIEINVDKVFTYGDVAWHRLDDNRATPLTKEIISPLFIPYVEGQASVNIDGIETPLEGWKTIVADLRNHEDIEGDFRPIHVARDRYEILQNENLFDAFQEALEGIPYDIVSAGTLGGLSFFFASVKFKEDFNIKLPDGSECKAYFSLFTSHNGTKNASYYDTTHRTVCMNSVRSSLQARGEQGFNITHTKNASVRIHDMAKIVNNVFHGRRQFEEKMAELYSLECDLSKAEKFTAGYLAEKTDAKEKLSTRSLNQMRDIVSLAWNGAGNRGGNFFYLSQGATEFWTRGNGTGGPKKDVGRKAFSSEFGTGMDNKMNFISALIDPAKREKLIKKGDAVLAASI
jgi:hypothetical protein